MASCLTITNGICRDCLDSVGGIKKAYLCPTQDLYTLLASVDPENPITDGHIADYTLADPNNPVKWYPLVPQKNTSNYVETINISAESGTLFYNGVLTMNFGKMTQVKLNTIHEMAKGDMTVVFLDGNGKYWWFGGLNVTVSGGVPATFTIDETNGCTLGSTSFQTGTAKADANGASLTFTCDMPHPVVEVDVENSTKIKADFIAADGRC